jgi:DNA-binding SARP family transcriptional activator
MLRVELFGVFAIETDAQAEVNLGSATRRLAAYLFTFPNKPHRREKLMDLGWGEIESGQARARLSTALWRIRKLFKGEARSRIALKANAHEVSLTLAELETVDVHGFQAAVASAALPDRRGFSADALDAAVRLYTAPFLEAYDDAWVVAERERLQSLYLRCLTVLMTARAGQRRYEDALAYGRQVLAVDPMREVTQRAVMLLYVLNGQRVEAMRQFKRCAEALRTECDVEPSPETHALFGLIRTGEIFQSAVSLAEAHFGGETAATLHS